jgi:hypothetical protein
MNNTVLYERECKILGDILRTSFKEVIASGKYTIEEIRALCYRIGAGDAFEK